MKLSLLFVPLLGILCLQPAEAVCTFVPNTDYNEGSGGTHVTGLTPEQCCQLCQNTTGCWVAVMSTPYDDPPLACWLKPANAKPTYKDGVIACFPMALPPTPPPPAQPYNVSVISLDPNPVVSWVGGNSQFQQVFNPSWVVASPGTGGKTGLMIRTQNCSACSPTNCCHCSGTGPMASVMTFTELLTPDNATAPPTFNPVSGASIVFGPHTPIDAKGTEDPRIAYDAASGLYYMFYTAYGTGVELFEASTPNPTSMSDWTIHGSVGFGQGSKSAALLIRDSPPHYLLWGDQQIRITQSNNLTQWTPGNVLIAPRADSFDSQLVEAGPPPMKLSTGDYIFFYNSADQSTEYHPGWLILSGSDPTQILARSNVPLISPLLPWMRGIAPYTCNVANVVFLEAAHPIGGDVFRVYFGGSDAVVGTALIQVSRT